MARGLCTEVSPSCPVQATTLGYYPNGALNIFIAAAFGVAALVTLGFGIWKRTWGYMSFIVAGCVLEMAGRRIFFFALADFWTSRRQVGDRTEDAFVSAVLWDGLLLDTLKLLPHTSCLVLGETPVEVRRYHMNTN